MHSRLSRQQWRKLLTLADPEAPAPERIEEPEDISNIVLAAFRHGLLPIVGRKLRSLNVPLSALDPSAREILKSFEHDALHLVGRTMLLDHHAQKLTNLFLESGVRAQIVKGPAFSNRLYKERAERVYSDIDFLVALDDMPKANEIMRASGFEIKEAALEKAKITLEHPWVLRTSTIPLLVELQGNLVHTPDMRKHLSYGYFEHTAADRLGAPEPVKLLTTAVMHTACSNRFDSLRVLVDVLQAARQLESQDYPKFLETVHAIGASLEVGTTLCLTAELFQDSKTRQAAQLFKSNPAVRLGSRLIREYTLYEPEGKRFPVGAWFKRKAFRKLQKMQWSRRDRAGALNQIAQAI